MTVQELIDALQQYPKDATVLIDCEEYCDYEISISQYLKESNTLILYAE